MIVENLTHDAANEAYILISAYVREDGRISAAYDKSKLKEFLDFLHDILKNPKNFRIQVEGEDEEVTVEDTGDSSSIGV
jgi:hypothetical protein